MRRGSVTVPLTEAAEAALHRLADREWRTLNQQATALVVDGLRRSGVLGDEANVKPTDGSENRS